MEFCFTGVDADFNRVYDFNYFSDYCCNFDSGNGVDYFETISVICVNYIKIGKKVGKTS